ncbi:Cys-Gln thioester bond-forming surface protein [Nocardiopsis sp. HNM0947]|uniref:Cys-Gln thioester bond-forming surface protein n=1 Tax=Nocardiopsis coralli TaxID=2772213 RepID=A0ABR9PDS4_9ACTN|nr:thioester domain-containing protein [Nocardiopsis coralli]MBE3002007.1 Cys-Gln thioester bond-forming surface protein [Nocardiopsis coralli]
MTAILRRCAALLSSAALVGAMVSAPAAAEDFSRVNGTPVHGVPVVLATGDEVPTALYGLRVGEHGSVHAYAASTDHEVQGNSAYVESGWDGVEGWSGTSQETDPSDRANWIVSNSYPNVPLAELAREADLPHLDEAEAVAATQSALWRVLDGVELSLEANEPDVIDVHDHLVERSTDTEVGEPAASVDVDPPHLELSSPEEPLGPLELSSTGDGPLAVSLRGAPESWLVDSDGEQIDSARDGDQVYLDVDPDVSSGVATLHVRGDGVPLPEGQLFTGRDGVSTAPLITAEPGTATSTATATLTWYPDEDSPSPETEAVAETEPPADEVPEPAVAEEPPPSESGEHTSGNRLASTGTWLSGLLVIAGALVVSGLLILVLGRKRRS